MKKNIQHIFSVVKGLSRRRSVMGGGVLFVALLAIPVLTLSSKEQVVRPSVEVGFSSLSPNGTAGGEIIPASCESGGIDHVSGRAVVDLGSGIHRIDPNTSYRAANFGNYCFGNSGPNAYPSPQRTWDEFSRFWGNFFRLTGMYYIN